MSVLETVSNKLKNGEVVNAVQYVRIEHFSERERDRILSDHGTKLCRNFLDGHPNITLVEEPYIDYGFRLLDSCPRDDLMKMLRRLNGGDVELVLIDDLHTLASSHADTLMLGYLFGDLDVAVLDMKCMDFYDLAEEEVDGYYVIPID